VATRQRPASPRTFRTVSGWSRSRAATDLEKPGRSRPLRPGPRQEDVAMAVPGELTRGRAILLPCLSRSLG
jgi:hypothetical protein